MEVSEEVREISSSNSVMCLLTDPEGEPLGAPLYLPQNAGPPQLQEIVNKLLKNGHKKWITGISWEPVHLQAPCRCFVSSSRDGDARIWDISLSKCVVSLSGHTLAVTCVKWGGDGMIYTSLWSKWVNVVDETFAGVIALA